MQPATRTAALFACLCSLVVALLTAPSAGAALNPQATSQQLSSGQVYGTAVWRLGTDGSGRYVLVLKNSAGTEIGGKMIGDKTFWTWLRPQLPTATPPSSAPSGSNQRISTTQVTGYGKYRLATDGSTNRVLVLTNSSGTEIGHKVIGSSAFWAWVKKGIDAAYPDSTTPPPPPPDPSPTPAPSPSPQTSWTAVRTLPLSDAQAAALVTHRSENRSANATTNNYVPSAAELSAFYNAKNSSGQTPAQRNPLYQYVTGRPGLSSPSTDDLIQWTAHKWGIPEDWVRAQMAKESWWRQSGLGDRRTVSNPSLYPPQARIAGTSDVYESMSIAQIKWRPDGSVGLGAEPLRWKSTPFAMDYYAATIRFYYDGNCGWCTSGYSAGQQWLSIGAWFSPNPWNNSGQNSYIQGVQSNLSNRVWAQPGF